MTEIIRPFTPDWVSPPGDTIIDILEERNLTQTQLSELLGYTTQELNQLINGKAEITEEIALKLETILGGTMRFWLNREAEYRFQLGSIKAENEAKSESEQIKVG